MGGGDDCFLSDIWISLAALGMLTQERQLPGAQARPRPGPSPDAGGTRDGLPQRYKQHPPPTPPPPATTRNNLGVTEPESLENFCS